MFIDIDYNKRKKGYKIYLAKPNKQIITNLSEGFDPTYGVKLGNVNELTFNIPYYIEKEDVRERNENVELIREKMYIKIEYNNEEEWMIIDSLEDIGEGSDMYLVVNSFSNVYETRHKKLTSVELGIVNPKEYYEHILADTSWVIGSIDATFANMYRTMEIGDSTVLESILEGGSTFGAILEFDSTNKRINLVDINKKSEYKGLKINYNNFLTSINRTRDTDSMATRLYVYGSEGLTIDRANPTGMSYLEDFSYFLYPFKRDANREVIEHSHYMSDELAHAILDMEELTEEYAPQIKVKQTETDALIIQLINQETALNSLQFDVNTIKGLLDIAKALGDTSLVTQRTRELTQAEALVVSKTTQVETIKAQIDALDRQIVNMQSSISITSFTKALRDELNPFIIESDFTDERYVDDRELYDDAVKKFTEAKTPNITIDASIDNIINSLEEEYFSDKIILGDLARITDEDMNIDFKSLIIELTFGLDSNDCQVVIANEPAEVGGFDKILSILYDTQSTTSQLESNKHKWDSVTELRTEVDILRDGGIDAVKNRITAGVNESVVIGDRGIVLTNPDFPDELVIMQAGVIALSTDGGENWSTSITPSGVIADTIIGKLVASNNLLITNDKGTFRIDSDGLTIDMDSIKIMSGSDNTPENILDTWNQVILTMEDFANDNVLNVYEKSQIKKQWDSIVATHSSMISVAQDAYGPETPENPYPVEYDRYLESYENFNRFLNVTLQSDGHTVLDPNTMNQTTPVNSATYDLVVREYQKHKDTFQTVIPLDFAKSSIEILEQGISLNYVRNGEVATQLNLSEEGVRIDGRLLEINAKTEFNDDLTMNAGVIKSKDNGIVIDLNEGTINLSRPLTINAVPVATKDDLDAIELQEGKSAYEIAVINGFTGSESQWLASLEGTEGERGIQGPKGINGENSYVHVAWSDSADGLVGFTQNNSANKLYMGIYTNNVEQSSAVPADYEWVKVKGDRGDNAPIVKITGATQIIKVDKDGVVTPSSTFTVSGAGINTNITSWTYSVDGGDFTSAQPTGVLRDGNTITVSPSSSTFKLLVIRASDGKVNDEFTIARTNDGLTGKDAYTVLLSNESHTFAGTETYAVLANTTTTVMAYKGTTKIPVTINSVTGLPTGMTASITKNNTVDAGVTFTVNNSLVTISGKVEIRMTIDENGISKDFSYALALKGVKGETGDVGPRGATGEQGPRGDQGTSVTGVTEWYLATSLSSGVTTTTSGWTNAIQTMATDKRFLWNYEQIGFSDGRTQDTIPVIIGAYGQTGGTGATGRSIVSIEENYLASASASGITRTSAGWTTAIQTTDATKKYLWNYEKITWNSAPLVTYVEPIIIGVHGEKGAKGDTGSDGVAGKDGIGIKSTKNEYVLNASGTTAPTTGWSISVPTLVKGQFLWTRTTWTYTDNTTEIGYSVSYIAKDGNNGEDGIAGKDGVGIEDTTIQYASSSSGTSIPSTGWSTTIPTVPEGQFLWTKTTWTYTDNTTETGYSVAKMGAKGDKGDTGAKGATGSQGPKGDTGTSVNSVTEYYLSSASNSGVTTATSGWSNAIQTINNTNKYLWNYEKINFSDGTSQNTIPVIMGVYGDTGPQGATGATGDVGRSITGVAEYYLATASATGVTRSTSGWTTAMQVTTATKKYLWNYEIITWNKAPITTYVEPIIIGIQGDKGDTGSTGPQGNTGPKGADGKDGVSVTKTDVMYYLSTSATALAGGSWVTTPPTWASGKYMWTKTVTTYSNGTTSETGAVNVTGAQGPQGSTGGTGPKGSDGRSVDKLEEQYYLSTSKDTLVGGSWSTTQPEWGIGLYIWTRIKISYLNPTGTGYTEPIVDPSWEAIEFIDGKVNEKVDKDIFDLTLEELAEAKSLAMDAINSGEYASFIEGYEEYKQLMEADKKIAEETLQRINDTIVAIENNLGTSSEKWNFIDSSITNAEGGVAIANAKTSMSVVVGSDRISFFDNEVEVAFITNKVLQITHGIFVTSVQIGAHLISSLPENRDITVVQWVGF